jgi:hypothetical protein
MAENQVDAAHFLHVHGAARMPTIVAERHGHRLLVRSTAAEATELGVLSGRVEVNSYGLGVTVIRFIGLFETLLAAGVTPIDDEHVHLRLAVTVRKVGEEATRAVGEAFLREVHHQLEEDTPIWENKAYVEHPLLVDGDGPIGIFRAWSRQFYPELTEAPTP